MYTDLDEDEIDTLLGEYGTKEVQFRGRTLREIKTERCIAEYRWAQIDLIVYQDVNDGSFWGFQVESSDTEIHEPWSYVQPALLSVKDRTTVVYSLA